MSRRSEYGLSGALDTVTGSMVAVTPSGETTRQAAPWYETLIQTAVPVVATAYQQSQMTKLNIARINQGLPPLTAEQYAAVYQPPSAQVQVGPTKQATNLLMIGGLLVLGYVGLKAAKVI